MTPTRDEIEAALKKMPANNAGYDKWGIWAWWHKDVLRSTLSQPAQQEAAVDMVQSYDIEKEPEKFGFVKGWNARGNSLQEAQPAPTGWRTIDSAPRDGQPFIAFGPKGIFETWWDCVDGGGHPENGPELYWWVSDDTEYCDGPYDAPTHWMPLPPEPDKSE